MINRIKKNIPQHTRWFDIIETRGTSTPIAFKNNRIHSITEKENSGLGFRINIDNRTGFSYTNDMNNFEPVIEKAIRLSKYSDVEQFSLPASTGNTMEPYNDAINSFDKQNEISKAESAIERIRSVHPQATTNISINCSQGEQHITNSEGLDCAYKNSYYSASVSVTYIKDNGEKLDIWEGISALSPVDYTDMVETIITKISNAKTTHTLKSGKIPVLLSPKALSSIIGIVLSGFNARTVDKGLSPFSDKIGKKVFNRAFAIEDNPLQTGSPFSFPFDDEGTLSQNKHLVKEGHVTQFISDLKYASRLGISPSGNASRGYSSLPYPSFSNIIIANGEQSIDEIMRSIKHGILVEQFIGLGQSNTLTGDFSANLDLAYIISEGEVTGRVKDCMITDNIHSLLAGDLSISSEREQQGASLCPYILLPEIHFTA